VVFIDGVPGQGPGRPAGVPQLALHADSGTVIASASHPAPVVTRQLRAAGASLGFLISWNHQEFWRLLPVMRTQFLAAVPTWFSQMETPIGFTTGGSLVAYFARDDMHRSSRDAHAVTMAIWVTEYLAMA